MRRPAAIVLGAVVVGVIGLVLAATLRSTPLAFTLGVPPAGAVAPLNHGDIACQAPIDVPEGSAFDRVTTQVGTYGASGSPLGVSVESLGGRILASGRIPGGYPDVAQQPTHDISLNRTVQPGRVRVCIRNRGRARVAIYGGPDLAARSSTATLDDKPLGADLDLTFERAPRSYAQVVPDMLSRAALFRFPWMGAWTYVVLLVVLVAGGTWLLMRATAAAGSEPGPTDGAR